MKLRPNKQKSPTPKRRKNRAKTKRQEHARKMNVLAAVKRKLRSDVSITALRLERDEEVVVGVREGLFGHPRTTLLRLDDIAIAGAAEDVGELAKLVNNVGILVTSQLFGHNLAEGLQDLGKSIARWAGIDIEALKKADAEESAPPAEPATTIEVPSVNDITP